MPQATCRLLGVCLSSRLIPSLSGKFFHITYILYTVNSRYLEVVGTNFYKFKLPALRVIWTCKKVSNAKLWLEKAIKIYF